jgi:hypothetical protein
MHVICKKCGGKIVVAGRPKGFTSLSGVQTGGGVNVRGGEIRLGPGGSIAFGPGGTVGFGGPRNSSFTCPACGSTGEYRPDEINEN